MRYSICPQKVDDQNYVYSVWSYYLLVINECQC